MEPMHKINKVEVRNLQIEDYIQLSQSFKRVYADKDVFWTHEQIETLIRIFPEGQVVTVVDDKIVGCALSIIVDTIASYPNKALSATANYNRPGTLTVHFEANRSGNVTSEYSFEKKEWTPINVFGSFDEIVWIN